MIAINLGTKYQQLPGIALNKNKDGTFIILNPKYTYQSDTFFTMYDDCMSFPSLLVKVKRHTKIAIGKVFIFGSMLVFDL